MPRPHLFGEVDRKLALSFGAVVMALMLTVAGVAATLFAQLQRKEENRLSGALGTILSESISRVSFSGKYHARLLVEEMHARVPALLYISVESKDGEVLAHSDPARNDSPVGPEDLAFSRRSLATGEALVRERAIDSRHVKEVVLPFRGGFGSETKGVVRLGINLTDTRREALAAPLKLLLLITALSVLAMVVVVVLSRSFGATMRKLAIQLQGILDFAPQAICISDAQGRIKARSVEMERMLGELSLDEPLGAQLRGKLSQADVDRIEAMDRRVFQEGVELEQELEVQLSSGPAHWLLSIFPIAHDKSGTVSLVCTFLRDISERKRAEQALRESEQNYREIFSATSDALFIHDKSGRILDVNDRMCALYGLDRLQALRSSLRDISSNEPPFTQDEGVRRVQQAIKEGPQTFEWRCRRGNGECFWADVALRSCEIAGKLRVIASVRDITERKQADTEKEKLQAQLTQSQKMESIGRLAGGVAHDFNNMLGVIIGNAELGLEQSDVRNLHEHLKQIQAAAQRSADLTRQLLAFARKQTVAPKVLDLNETVAGMLKMLQRLIGENIELVWKPGGALWPVKVDPSQVDQVLANLAVNARDAIASEGTVTISTENAILDPAFCAAHEGSQPGPHVLLTFRDSGSGMGEETLSHLFEPFFTTKGVGKGTGLGLATVYGVIQQNRGTISVQSAPNAGTTFRIYLPRAEGVDGSQKADPPKPPTGTETILMVEDETAILTLGSSILRRLGYRVLEAQSPAEALKLDEQHAETVHLLITDVVMPGMNGKELADRLRASHPGLKTLFMSGYTADIIAHHGVLDEGVQFLQKPFSMNSLAQKVRDILD